LNYTVVIGRTPFLCWDITGIMLATMFENDDIDFYQENSQIMTIKYKTPAGFSDYIIEKKL
jgi:hypothetical protein